jgi:3-(3-hydroxy-phenyl)propionate hydroxylase
MPQADASEFQVVVVGFGPSGVVATSLLGAHGIRTLAIDKDRSVYDKPRAIALDHEILRLFDNLGVAERLAPFIAPFPASEHFGAKGQLIRRIDMVSEPYPLGYTPTMVFTQPPVEEALRAHARSYPEVVVELGTELRQLSQGATGVTLELRSDTSVTRNVTADYVIACDGASSGVRRQLGIRSRTRRWQNCRAPPRSSAILRGRPPTLSALRRTGASRSCCCRAKIRATSSSLSKSGGC